MPGIRGLRQLWLLRGTCYTGGSSQTSLPLCGLRIAPGSFEGLQGVHSVNHDPPGDTTAQASQGTATFDGLGVHIGPAVGTLSLDAFAGLGGPRNVTAALQVALFGSSGALADAQIIALRISACNVSEFLPMAQGSMLPHLQELTISPQSVAVPNGSYSFNRPARTYPAAAGFGPEAVDPWDAYAAAEAVEDETDAPYADWSQRWDVIAAQSGVRLRRGWVAGMPALDSLGSGAARALQLTDMCAYTDVPGDVVTELMNATSRETRSFVTPHRTLHLDAFAGIRLSATGAYGLNYELGMGVLHEALFNVPHCVNTRLAASAGSILTPPLGITVPGLPYAPRITEYDFSGLNASAATGGIAGILARFPLRLRSPTETMCLVRTPALTVVTAADFVGCPNLQAVSFGSFQPMSVGDPAYESGLLRLDSNAVSRASHPLLWLLDVRNTPLASQGCPSGYINTEITLVSNSPNRRNTVCEFSVATSAAAVVVPACSACPPGSWCEQGYQHRCPSGTYSDALAAESASTCRPCSPGTTNALTGQPRIGCVQCAPGYAGASAGGATDPAACAGCSPGRYADAPGLIACRSCPKGTWAAADAVAAAQSSVCEPCAQGRWSNADALVAAPNSTGSSSGSAGNSSAANTPTPAQDVPCTACPAGLTTMFRGATSPDACVAPACTPGHGRLPAGITSASSSSSGSNSGNSNSTGGSGSGSGSDTSGSGSGAQQQCSSCVAGYASAGGSGATCDRCPAGRWAAAEASTCTMCAGHTARAGMGGWAASSCSACPVPHTRCSLDRSACVALCPAGTSLRQDAATLASVAALLAQQPPVCGPLSTGEVAVFCAPCVVDVLAGSGDSSSSSAAVNTNATLCFPGRPQPLLSLAWAGDDATGATRSGSASGTSSSTAEAGGAGAAGSGAAFAASAAGSLAAVLGLPVAGSTGSASSGFSLASLGLSSSSDSGGNTFAPDCAGYVRATLVERPAAAYSSARASLLIATAAVALAVPLALIVAKRAAERCSPHPLPGADTIASKGKGISAGVPAGAVAIDAASPSSSSQSPSTVKTRHAHAHHPGAGGGSATRKDSRSRCSMCAGCIQTVAASVARMDMFATQHVPGEDRLLRERANFTGGLCAVAFAAAAIGMSASVLMRLSLARYALSVGQSGQHAPCANWGSRLCCNGCSAGRNSASATRPVRVVCMACCAGAGWLQ